MSPAIAPARVVRMPRRVQAIDKPLSDLVLRGGRSVAVEVGGAITTPPTLRRGLGNSSLELTIYDPELRWLRHSLAAETWDARIDGLWFRYLGTSKQGKSLTLKFEDRDVARLRELKGPKKAYRAKTTRAEFICGLVEELRPRVPITCPERDEVQPIASREDSEQAKDSARENRRAGLGDVKGLRVKGQAATKAQIEMGDRVLRVAEHEGAPYKVMVALIAACIVESLLGGVSSNLLQVESFVARDGGFAQTDVEASVRGFLRGYVPGHTGAIAYHRSNPGAPAHEIAQAVQRSGAGASSNGATNYGPHVEEAREWVDEYFGGDPQNASVDVTQLYTLFEVGKNESYWAAIQRLAKEVNWRAFFNAGRFYFISEPELLRSQVRFAISLGDDGRPEQTGVEEVDFDYNRNKPTTTATVTAFASKWGAPPGSVVTLKGYGPASIGFGSAPVKANSKGQRMGISDNRNARTGEGKGRYLVASVEVPLTGEGEARLATINLRKPTAPLPEPAAEKESRTVGGGADEEGTGSGAVEKMISEADRIDGLAKPYLWGGGHGGSTSAEGPWDCSGAVSRLLDVAGLLPGGTPVVSGRLAEMYEAGPGKEVTIYANATHVLIELRGRFWGTSGSNPGGGAGWLSEQSSGYLASFTKRHPKGL